MGGGTPLSDRSRTLFAIIAAAAEEGAETPGMPVRLRLALHAPGPGSLAKP